MDRRPGPGSPVDVVRCSTVDDLAASDADLAVICAHPRRGRGPCRPPARDLPRVPPDHDHDRGGVPGAPPDPAHEGPATGQARMGGHLRRPPRPPRHPGPERGGRPGQPGLRSCPRSQPSTRRLPPAALAELLGAVKEGEDPIAAKPRRRAGAHGRSHATNGRPRLTRSTSLRSTTTTVASTGFVVLLKDLSDQKEQQERCCRPPGWPTSASSRPASPTRSTPPWPRSPSARRACCGPRATRPSPTLPAFQNFPRYLKTIEEETFRCKKIIRALLEFSSEQPARRRRPCRPQRPRGESRRPRRPPDAAQAGDPRSARSIPSSRWSPPTTASSARCWSLCS